MAAAGQAFGLGPVCDWYKLYGYSNYMSVVQIGLSTCIFVGLCQSPADCSKTVTQSVYSVGRRVRYFGNGLVIVTSRSAYSYETSFSFRRLSLIHVTVKT